jgi:hypothetical protein
VKRTAWLTLVAGLIVGFGLGYLFVMAREGKIIGVMMYEPLLQSSDTAFAAYTSAEPTVAFWVLQRHLARLDEFEKRGFPRGEELLRQRFFTHARLAKLYANQGDSQQETRELELATATGFMHLTDKKDVYHALSAFDSRKVP